MAENLHYFILSSFLFTFLSICFIFLTSIMDFKKSKARLEALEIADKEEK